MSNQQTVTQLLAASGLPSTMPAERLRGMPAPARRLHRALLHAFAYTGTAPELAGTFAGLGFADADGRRTLATLAEADLVALDGDGGLAGVFPFSAAPSRHQVAVGGGPTVCAMCAIDALGIPAMLGRPGTVTSRDPATGDVITVRIDGVALDWTPHCAVVLVGRAGDGPLALSCCRVIDFYTERGDAEAALAQPGWHGVVLDVPAAFALAIAIFGDQLRDDEPAHADD
jgi:hypothetical protein